MKIYCMKCRQHTNSRNLDVVQGKNGRFHLKSTCTKCGSAKSKPISKQQLGGSFWTDFVDGFKMPFQALNNLGKPVRGIAGKFFDKIPGNPLAKLPGGSTPWVGFANDQAL